MTKAYFKRAAPYAEDELNLPVNDLAEAVSFYETVFNMELISRSDMPHRSAILARDNIKIGLAENGGDPTQEGCFFEVDNVESAFAELKSNGLSQDASKYSVEDLPDGHSYRLFYVVAPDGLCYCIGEPIKE